MLPMGEAVGGKGKKKKKSLYHRSALMRLQTQEAGPQEDRLDQKITVTATPH